jgi:hypothetical protein
MSSKNHVHKYQYKNIGNKAKPRKVYACAFPDCTHYLPTISLARGKETICHQCGEKMILSSDIVRQRTVKPRCLYCRGKMKRPEDTSKLDRAVEMLLALKA